jgi:hypothetical protein
MRDVIHPGINRIAMGTTPFSSNLVIRWLIVIVVVAVIILVSVLANLQSLTNNQQITNSSDGIQPLVPGIGLIPTSSPIIKHPGTRTVFIPFINKFGFTTQMRPYSSNSYWNIPIANNPEYDPHSTEMIATIGLDGDGSIGSDPNQYSFPVYYADFNTPRWDIPCTKYKCTVVTLEETYTVDVLTDVPIPDMARPSPGSDGQMIIIDKNTFTEYDLWQVLPTPGGWSISNGSVYNILWDGTPERYGSRGAGVPYLAGLIRPWEIIQGHIDHSLAFSYAETAKDLCVYPASRTDGDSSLPYAIPQGAHLQLDPTLTDADFNLMGLSRTGKIIAKALQVYGMTLVDTSGHAKIYVEDLQINPYADVDWADPDLNLTPVTIASIPYTYFRVLKLPEAYWNPELGLATYRECYDYTNR